MTERKQGRRSAQAAEETKLQIMSVAAEMFCELGYERVSLRNISEQAGVSHSLIRHHFGSKENIWHSISDCLHSYILRYMYALIDDMPAGLPSNIRLYRFNIRMLAHMIIHPQSIQLIADAVRQEDALFDYFIDNSGDIERLVQTLLDAFNADHPSQPIQIKEMKWQLMMFGHSAASLRPFVLDTWDTCETIDKALLQHWEMFNRQMASQLDISPDLMQHPACLEELLLPLDCEWCCSNGSDYPQDT
ncbi:TetR family transcriptional regulator [Photobacterium aquae]|uniref:TetR family transcriptional regulator n=1 Tax=Photobacterium aquae TaxID=1195763 RepID=A0A0J1GY57_9GAMM|nr:TetR/AcrR family transcriptional regulator [Photobacterium aquae]KLV04600.1 TetR family transcriptional regulator [Photobacterium aquae]